MDHFFDRRLLEEEQRLSKLLESLESKSDLSHDRMSIVQSRPFRSKCEKGVQTQDPGFESHSRNSPHAAWVSILTQQEQADLRAKLAEKDDQISRLQQLLRNFSDQLRRSQEHQRAIGISLQSKLLQLEAQHLPDPAGDILQSMEADIERLGATREDVARMQRSLSPSPRSLEDTSAGQGATRAVQELSVASASNPSEQEAGQPQISRRSSARGARNSYIARPIVNVKQRAQMFSSK